MEEEISLVELFQIIKKRMALIVNAVLVGILLASIYTFFIATPQYSATTDLLVNRSQDESSAIERSEIDTNLQLINTYSDIITRPVILDNVREELDMETSTEALANQFEISNQDNSQMFSVTVTGENPYDVATIANTTATVFQDTIPELLNVDNVAVLSTAEADTDPVSPNAALNLAIGLVLGGMIGVGLTFLFEFLDNTVKDDKFIANELGWTNLGAISEMSAEELASDGRQDAPRRAANQEKSGTRSARTRV